LKIPKALPFPMFQTVDAFAQKRPARPFDTGSVADTIQRALAAAGLDTQSGPMQGVTDTIHRALSAAGLSRRAVTPGANDARGETIDGTSRRIDATCGDIDGTQPEPAAPVDAPLAGAFLNRSYTNHAGTRDYKLYVPARYAADPDARAPVIVMLHGCTQSPDDFAAGTRMNALADRFGFLVIYPAQAANANGSRCWNWFRPEDQVRDAGEPSLIAGITREVASAWRVDARRIFVAGLSAGASMALILGAMYPELYAAIGAHSGLPRGAAHDMPSAFAAMQGNAAQSGRFNSSSTATLDRDGESFRTPTIVFHGDHDRTVNARNADAIVGQAAASGPDGEPLRAEVRTGQAPGGRQYSRTDYLDDADRSVVEHWVVHGAGHAWSGGSPNGSFTDPAGPDASAEMIRFFLAQRRAGTA